MKFLDLDGLLSASIIIGLSASVAPSQASGDSADLFPLRIGNYWEYGGHTGSHGGVQKFDQHRVEIVDRLDSADVTYYLVAHRFVRQSTYQGNTTTTVDSSEYTTYLRESGNEIFANGYTTNTEFHWHWVKKQANINSVYLKMAVHALLPGDTLFTQRAIGGKTVSYRLQPKNAEGNFALSCNVIRDGIFCPYHVTSFRPGLGFGSLGIMGDYTHYLQRSGNTRDVVGAERSKRAATHPMALHLRNGILTLVGGGRGHFRLTLFFLDGRPVGEWSATGEGPWSFHPGVLPSGTYCAVLSSDQGMEKAVIAHVAP